MRSKSQTPSSENQRPVEPYAGTGKGQVAHAPAPLARAPRLNDMTIDEALNVLSTIHPDRQAEALIEYDMSLKDKDVRERARFIVASECPQTRYVAKLAYYLREYDRRQANKPSRKPKKTEERVGRSFAESWGVNTFGEFVSPQPAASDKKASSDEPARSSDKKEE